MKGILLINLGSPKDLEDSSVKDYLKEFLSDVNFIGFGHRWAYLEATLSRILNLFFLNFVIIYLFNLIIIDFLSFFFNIFGVLRIVDEFLFNFIFGFLSIIFNRFFFFFLLVFAWE